MGENGLNAAKNCNLVNLVQSNWNDLVSDFYRVKGIITVLYPTNYIPGLSSFMQPMI